MSSATMPFSNKRVLVTGCAGFLGPWLCQLLVAGNASVVGLDKRYLQGSRIFELENKVERVTQDISHYAELEKLIREKEINFIFHLAAQAVVGIANKHPLQTFKDNVEGTWNVLEAARANGVEGIVVSTSDKAYGEAETLPYSESTELRGRFPYDVSKSCADLISQSYYHSFGLPVAIMRCGNLYGPGDLTESRIIPSTILSLLNNEPVIIRSDGSPVRDYLYVEDAAKGFSLVGEKLLSEPGIRGQAFNLSHGTPVSVLHLVKLILSLAGQENVEPQILANAPLEIQEQYLCSDLIRTTLNWAPAVDLETGLRRTLDWYGEKHSASILPNAREWTVSPVSTSSS